MPLTYLTTYAKVVEVVTAATIDNVGVHACGRAGSRRSRSKFFPVIGCPRRRCSLPFVFFFFLDSRSPFAKQQISFNLHAPKQRLAHLIRLDFVNKVFIYHVRHSDTQPRRAKRYGTTHCQVSLDVHFIARQSSGMRSYVYTFWYLNAVN